MADHLMFPPSCFLSPPWNEPLELRAKANLSSLVASRQVFGHSEKCNTDGFRWVRQHQTNSSENLHPSAVGNRSQVESHRDLSWASVIYLSTEARKSKINRETSPLPIFITCFLLSPSPELKFLDLVSPFSIPMTTLELFYGQQKPRYTGQQKRQVNKGSQWQSSGYGAPAVGGIRWWSMNALSTHVWSSAPPSCLLWQLKTLLSLSHASLLL